MSPDDDKFLEAAIEGRAQYVVTGDKDLLGMKTYRDVRIVTPAAFLTILRTHQLTDRGHQEVQDKHVTIKALSDRGGQTHPDADVPTRMLVC